MAHFTLIIDAAVVQYFSDDNVRVPAWYMTSQIKV
jgi:hypothetical protein